LSKVQNNVVTMHRNSTDKTLSVLLELQPLARKTVETLVTALRHVIETVANRMASSMKGRVARLIHCMAGDGIYTNNAAPLQWLHATTHAAKLIVRIAICDDARNVDFHPLAATSPAVVAQWKSCTDNG
jgi:hypothetical protein